MIRNNWSNTADTDIYLPPPIHPVTMGHFGSYLNRNKAWLSDFTASMAIAPKAMVSNHEYLQRANEDMLACFDKVPRIFFGDSLDLEVSLFVASTVSIVA